MNHFRRIISALMSLIMLVGLFPAQAFAENAEPAALPEEAALETPEKTAISPEEDWEVVFPYGTFAFANSEASVTEGGDTLIDVLRLGGTIGKATIFVLYSPTVNPLDEDRYSYGMAAGSDDILIEGENTQPAAFYQPTGKLPDPEETDVKPVARPYTGKDAQEGDLYLTLDVAADSYDWQYKGEFRWISMEGGTKDGMIITPEQLEQADLRCVYTLGGKRFCTDSYHGVVYEKPEPEELKEMPADLDLNPEQTFSAVNQGNSEDPYRAYIFALTFADGEDRKQIRVTAPEDDAAEAIKAGSFTLIDCEGGSLYDSASTLALLVADNDEPDPFSIGFTVESVTVDKSAGVAVLEVRRSGGNQTMVSIDYETEDGSAVAGEDYVAVSGTLGFYADADLMKIEVPLINDGIANEETVDFKLKLVNLKGDSKELCTLETTEATVNLYNTATAEAENLPTMLRDGTALDASGDVELTRTSAAPVDPAPISGRQVEVLPNPLKARIDGYDGKELDLQTYDYGAIHFSRYDIPDYYSSYWDDNLYLKGSNPEGGSWNGGQASGEYWKYQSKNAGYAALTVPYFHEKFYSFYGSYEYEVGMEDNTFTAEFVYPFAALMSQKIGDWVASTQPSLKVSGNFLSGFKVSYDSGGNLSYDWDLNASKKTTAVIIGLKKYDEDNGDHDGWCDMTYARVSRRTFENELQLRIHTCNDGDNPGGVHTAPEGAAALEENSGVYAQMKPEITLLNGGVNYWGELYVGSTLQVSLKNTPAFRPLTTQALTSAVYVTRSDGSICTQAQITQAGGNKYNILMVWDGMTQADLEETYTINVAMLRVQDFELNLTPSVPRLVDEDGRTLADIDTSRIPEAWDMFWNSPADPARNNISYGYSYAYDDAPHYRPEAVLGTLDKSYFSGDAMDPVKVLDDCPNFQWINFNRSPEDRIIYNGRSYAGNDTIWLDTADLAQPKATFRYYNAAYLTAISVMRASINYVAVYWDGNANGKIDGRYDPNTGYFVLDEDTEDELVKYLDDGEKLEETLFSPVEIERNGETVLAPFFFRISYTMTPRSLTPEAGQEYSMAQVIPAIVTSITDPDNYAKLTEEQRSYRYIYSGKDADGNYTSDNHPMYGPKATAVQAVDVPLGGGANPVKIVDGEYVWDPHYEGNLMFPSENPEPVFIPRSLAGENLPVTDAYSYTEDGELEMTAEGAEELNGFLGSLTGNNTIALCIQEQEELTSELATRDKRDNSDEEKKIKPESATPVDNSVYESVDQVKDVDAGVDTDDNQASMDMDESGSDFPEFNLDLRTQMPKFTCGGTDHSFVTVAVSGYEIEVGFSFPIFSRDLKEGKNQWAKGGITDNFKQFSAMKNFVTGKGWDSLADDSLKEALKSDGECVSSDFALSFSFSCVVAWKYNPVINDFFFERFAFTATCALEFKLTARFAAAPVIYLYLKCGISVSLSTGGTFIRVVDEEDTPVVGEDQTDESLRSLQLKKGRAFQFQTEYKTFNIDFDGKIAVELYEDAAHTKLVEDSIRGYLNSDGGDDITVNLMRQDGMKLDGNYYVRIIALEDTEITKIVRVYDSHRESYWNGIQFSPEAYIEVGAGIGAEIAKFELFAKLAITAAMTLGAYDEETRDYGVFAMDEFNVDISLGFRFVFLLLSYEMDLIGYHVGYENGEGWSHSWRALGDLYGGELGVGDQTQGGVHIKQPANTSGSQNIYSNDPKELDLLSFDANDPAVPFQLSGFSTSGDAFKLADGLTVGYDYRVVSVGDDNYVVYTISRADAENAMDNSMLVLSKLRLTGTAYGLVNPVDEADETPYILLDTIMRTTTPEPTHPGEQVEPVTVFEDDGTGDLGFDVWSEGKTIHAVWVSYDAPTPAGEARSSAEAARHTLIKRASFDTENGKGFTDARELSASGANVALPGGGSDATVYVRSVHMSQQERQQAEDGLTAYLKSIGNDPDDEVNASGMVGRYRLATQSAFWDVNGKASSLCVTLESGAKSSLQLADGQTVENVECTKIGDVYYLAYTTTELRYTDADGNSVPNGAQAKNLLTIKRMLVRTFTVENGQVVWTNHGEAGDENKGVLLRTLYDYDDNSVLQDGVYRNGTVDAVENPFFSNLQFLRGKLGESLVGEEEEFTLQADRIEDFLLFEMNGSTYVIREDSLVSIATQKKGTIITFFAPAINSSGKQDETTGRDCVTIGADSAGNIAAIYVGTVDHTTNNALYLTKFDPETGSWGAGTILAMNHMDVYEDVAASSWTADECEQAYLGKLADCDGGSMDQFVFQNLQFALGANIENHDSLLILTQGNMTYLMDAKAEVGGEQKDLVIPVPDDKTQDIERAAVNPAGIGVYAISYGVGQQAIGEGGLKTQSYDFTGGSDLYATVQFTNIGDIGIRGSDKENQEISVQLDAQTEFGTLPLAAWEITENIIPGQTVKLAATFRVEQTLPTGSRLTLTVSEGDYYKADGGVPYTASLDLYTISASPELGYEEYSIKPIGIDAQGNTILSVDMLIGNRGTESAENVRLQFSYDLGEKDDADQAVFAALDITGHNLNVSEQELLPMAAGDDLQNGILTLGKIDPGYGRWIHGTITVAPKQYLGAGTGSLNLQTEILSDADKLQELTDTGLYQVRHGEYNGQDNLRSVSIEHRTFFAAASKVTIPLGNTLHLPISLATTTGDDMPRILVTEFADQDLADNLGILSYEGSGYANGSESGALIIAPSQTGTGFIRVLDANTNSFYDIAYTVTDPAEGINIFIDNGMFTFKNKNGSVYDATAAASSQNWVFDETAKIWGADGTAPYLNNLSRGEVGSSFTFDTQSESIDLIFNGTVRVESTMPGFEPVTMKAGGGDGDADGEYASVRFGSNSNNTTHTVTITVTEGAGTGMYADFDRLIEHFGSAGTPTPAEDAVSPQIYWSRSFPDTASILLGETVYLSAYILDDSALANVVVDGKTPEGLIQHAGNFWEIPFAIDSNYTFTIEAIDNNGNRTARVITVKWFNSVLTIGAIGTAPGLLRTDLSFVDDAFQPVPENEALNFAPWLQSSYVPAENETSTAYIFYNGAMSDTPLARGSGEHWRAISNGIYMVHIERDDGTWARAFLELDRLDLSEPLLTVTPADYAIEITASDNEALEELTVNGYPLPVSGSLYSGSFAVPFSGSYTVIAVDNAGNRTEQTVALDFPLTLEEDAVSWNYSCANNILEGSVTIDPMKIAGGAYDPQISKPEENLYVAMRSAALVENGKQPSEQDYILLSDAPLVFEKLAEGDYQLYVRDSSGTEIVWGEVLPVWHAADSWTEPNYVWSEDNSSVTASRYCKVDASHFETETVQTTFILDQPSTFDGKGAGHYVAEFESEAFETQIKQIEIPEVACVGGDACPSVAFTDMPPLTSYMHIPIDWAVLNQITFGTSPTTFGPEDSCTRAQFVTFLWRVKGQPEPETDNNPFKDVKPTAYYYKPVLWAVEQGVTAGTSPTTFSPNNKVTRAQVVTFLWRYEGSPEASSEENPFTDVKPDAYYHAAVLWAVGKKITSGTSETTFSPNDNCTRAQCVTFLYREFGN